MHSKRARSDSQLLSTAQLTKSNVLQLEAKAPGKECIEGSSITCSACQPHIYLVTSFLRTQAMPKHLTSSMFLVGYGFGNTDIKVDEHSWLELLDVHCFIQATIRCALLHPGIFFFFSKVYSLLLSSHSGASHVLCFFVFLMLYFEVKA